MITVPANPKTDAAKKEQSTQDLIIWSMVLFVTLMALALILRWLDRWKKRQFREDNPIETVGSFRDMLESGEITQGEYDKIIRRISDRARRQAPATGSIQSLPNDSSSSSS
jgi:hypothetical protein